MREPEIRYTRTEDGLSIAYTVYGEGEPLIVTAPLGYSHLALELRYGPLAQWYERLSHGRAVVRFDWRAQGLSQRNVPAPPRMWGETDLRAVVDAIGAERVDLLGCGSSGFWAAAFAAAAPERVRNLILWATPATGFAWGAREVEIATSLATQDYRIFTETIAAAILGFEDPQRAHAWAQFIRRAMNEEDHHTFADMPTVPGGRGTSKTRLSEEAVDAILRRIGARTLVLHPAGFRNMPLDSAQQLTAAISGARLLICDDDRSGLPIGEQATAAIETFLGGSVSPPRPAEPTAALPGTAVILFADIADSTALTERLGDARFRERARALDDALRAAVREHGGAVIDAKTLGDGILATFAAASQAIAAALACASAGSHAGLPLHVGLHAGDVIREADNVFGGAVNIAARISALAAPGEVLVSDIVRGLARTSAVVTFEDRGEHALKGIAEPQRVFAVKPLD